MRWRFVAVILWGASLGVTARAASEAASPSVFPLLDEIQASLASVTNVVSDFVQEKDLAILQQRVVIKGRMVVQQPGRFSWQVEEPVRYNLVLDGTALKQWDETTDKVQQMSLAGNPVLAVVANQLRAWFGGQLDELLKDFDAAEDPSSTAPAIVFTPHEESFAARAVSRIVLTFREDRRYVQEMLIEEKSGDRTRMIFLHTVLNGAVDPAAWEVKPRGR